MSVNTCDCKMNRYVHLFYSFNQSLVKSLTIKRSPNAFFDSNCYKLCVTQLRFAGHSKWQNIKSTKEKMDSAKSRLHQKYSNLIKTMARVGGSADPKVNMKLKAAIEEAKSMNVRKEVIDRALERAQNAKIQPCVLEIQGPGGCFFIANCETDNVSILRHDIKKIMRKTKSQFMQEGCARYAFTEKGLIRIAKKDKNGSPITFEKIEELAIEAEAEEVVEEKIENDAESINNETEDSLWLLKTSSDDFYRVKQYFEQQTPDLQIISAELEFEPNRYVELTDEEISLASQLVEVLEEMPAIVKLYNNIKLD